MNLEEIVNCLESNNRTLEFAAINVIDSEVEELIKCEILLNNLKIENIMKRIDIVNKILYELGRFRIEKTNFGDAIIAKCKNTTFTYYIESMLLKQKKENIEVHLKGDDISIQLDITVAKLRLNEGGKEVEHCVCEHDLLNVLKILINT